VSGTPAELIRRFLRVQTRRAEIYSRFHAAFKSHLASRLDGAAYAAETRDVTDAFAACSLEAIACEEALAARGRDAAAASIRVAQMGEKTKLNMTCTLQVLRKAAAPGRWRWQRQEERPRGDDGEGELEDEEAPAPSVLRPGFANGNFRGRCPAHARSDAPIPGRASCCGCLDESREPTREEYEGALAEATRALEDAVVGINDALDELREALDEEDDDAEGEIESGVIPARESESERRWVF